MPQAVAANEVNYQKHQQAAGYHHGYGNLQAELHVVKVGNSTNELRAKSSDKLGNKHIDADRGGVRTARHHVVNYSSNGAVVPRHEESGYRERCQHEWFFLGLNGQDHKRGREQKRDGNGDDAPEGEAPLQSIGYETAEEDAGQAAD